MSYLCYTVTQVLTPQCDREDIANRRHLHLDKYFTALYLYLQMGRHRPILETHSLEGIDGNQTRHRTGCAVAKKPLLLLRYKSTYLI